MKEKIFLDWNSLELLSSVNNHNERHRGVYIWGFTIDQVFVPYYVGIAENIIPRIYEHVNSIIGGKYNIFHKESLKDFLKYKSTDPDIDSKGKLFTPDWPFGYNKFLRIRDRLAPHIDYMVDTFSFSFAAVNEKYNTYDLKCIEKICITKIGTEKLINIRCGKSDKFELEHIGNKLITEIFNKIREKV